LNGRTRRSLPPLNCVVRLSGIPNSISFVDSPAIGLNGRTAIERIGATFDVFFLCHTKKAAASKTTASVGESQWRRYKECPRRVFGAVSAMDDVEPGSVASEGTKLTLWVPSSELSTTDATNL